MALRVNKTNFLFLNDFTVLTPIYFAHNKDLWTLVFALIIKKRFSTTGILTIS